MRYQANLILDHVKFLQLLAGKIIGVNIFLLTKFARA